MSNYDAWLEQPFQDSLRQGEELEALEEKYQESAEFKENFEVWQRDCLPNIQARPSGMPFMGLPLDAYLTSDEYSRNLDAFIKAQYVQDEWETYDFPESDEALELWDTNYVHQSPSRVGRLFRRVRILPYRLMRVGVWK